MTTYLIIDTSTDRGIVALSQDGLITKSVELSGGRNLAQVVYEMTKYSELLSAHPLPVKLSAIIVGVGPGSYTGIRIALAFAKGYAFAQNIPLLPISGLFGLTPDSDGSFIAALDAKIGGVFCVEGRKFGSTVEWTSSPVSMSDQEFQNIISQKDLLVVIERSWLDHKGFKVDCSVVTTAPRPEQLLDLATKEISKGRAVLPQSVQPLYLRRTQAEIEREQR